MIIENSARFGALIERIQEQLSNGCGDFILSKEGKEISAAKVLELVVNPFALDINNKKVITKVYQELSELAQDKYLVQTAELHVAILSYLETLCMEITYPLEYSLELDVGMLFKAYSLKIGLEQTDIAERILEYVRLMHRCCGIKVFVFVNLKSYVGENELLEIYKFAGYENVNLILLERVQFTTFMEQEKTIIIDKDGCIIV